MIQQDYRYFRSEYWLFLNYFFNSKNKNVGKIATTTTLTILWPLGVLTEVKCILFRMDLRCCDDLRMMFSRNVFCGATRPRLPPGIFFLSLFLFPTFVTHFFFFFSLKIQLLDNDTFQKTFPFLFCHFFFLFQINNFVIASF